MLHAIYDTLYAHTYTEHSFLSHQQLALGLWNSRLLIAKSSDASGHKENTTKHKKKTHKNTQKTQRTHTNTRRTQKAQAYTQITQKTTKKPDDLEVR